MFSKSFLSAQGLTHVTIGINIASFLLATTKSFDNAYSISDNNSVSAMLVSMFTHLNAEHLVGNMLSLFFTSLSVFADAEWNSPRKSPSLTIDSMAQWMANLWNGFDHKNVQERYLLWRRAAAKRVGASGAVYGVVGARIYTAIWSPYHPPLNVNDVKTLLCLIGEELPRSFDMATESMVDHSAHLFGFAAWMWDTWLIYRRRKQDSHGSGKRRYIRSGILS